MIGHALFLATRYLRAHPVRTLVLVLGLAVALFLPAFTFLAAERVEEGLLTRATASPILLGHKGNEFDLTLSALYFDGAVRDPIPAGPPSGSPAPATGSPFRCTPATPPAVSPSSAPTWTTWTPAASRSPRGGGSPCSPRLSSAPMSPPASAWRRATPCARIWPICTTSPAATR